MTISFMGKTPVQNSFCISDLVCLMC
jgi:hypothetical protein